VIFGTAGHVDHGKTALVKALTGVDTDRLPEEKKRGITLELGFAQFGEHSVIDVPGHERFVKAMAAGAGGIDVVLLVIAADEGVMPQTREHVDICGLLGVRRGLIVITKADLLPELGEAWRALLEADISELVAGTFLETARRFEVSAKTGVGLETLKAGLASVQDAPSRSSEGPFFMPIDRAFTIKGFGCVVTGTVRSGHLTLTDSVELLPSKHTSLRLRGLQVHGHAVEQLGPGQRAAVNLVGIETGEVHRGMALTCSQQIPASTSLDVELTLLAASEHSMPVRSRQLLALGTDHVEAVVQLLDTDSLKPGHTGFAQVRLARPVAALPGQRFVLRGTRALTGRGATIGGGVVLALNSRRRRARATANLALLAQGTVETRVTWLLTEQGQTGLTETELFSRAGASGKELNRSLETAASRGRVVLVDKEQRRWLASSAFDALKQRAMARLEVFHSAFPQREGLPREELRQRLGLTHDKTFAKVLFALSDAKRLELYGEFIRVPGRGRSVDAVTEALMRRVLEAFRSAGLAPPSLALIASRVGLDEARVLGLVGALVAQNALVKAGALYFDAAALEALEVRVRTFFATSHTMTTAQFKELVGQSRKYTIPLAEYFDGRHVTLRVGELRTLRRREAAAE
jgi:selenocysteine-specific elongation factor